ncbi:hypothetical protein FXF50_04730 [Micromonospora sp. AP08]|uniref:hypothetical protein n=1 Tax=Micromonospora sp. AP08 TaxID=2604467 RepID=UPI0011DA3359|nr:hypothetical protein [Micromonospora sp. AP08]TYB39688.1 hypothetical protein FXF50_04730 [Micromonospora sp. AP08]
MNPFWYFAHRAAQQSTFTATRAAPESGYRICIEGLGDWGNRVYRPAIGAARASGSSIHALYRDVRPLSLTPELRTWEQFEEKRSAYEPPPEACDLLIVATPDTAHLGVLEAAAHPVGVAIVEKPFAATAAEAARACDLPGLVLGVDHYPAYIAAAADYADQIWEHLGAEVESVRFVLLQRAPIEVPRIPSLGTGLTFDMLSHFLALLVSLGIMGPLQYAAVAGAGQHLPLSPATSAGGPGHPEGLVYQAETWSETRFTLAIGQPPSTVSCTGLVGKGFPVDVRFLELVASSGAAVRLDLGSLSWREVGYPHGVVSLLSPAFRNNPGTWLRPDPSQILAVGPQLTTTRPYDGIVGQLTGGPTASRVSSCLFTLKECQWMMNLLEPLGTAARQLARSNDRADHDLGKYPAIDDRWIWC